MTCAIAFEWLHGTCFGEDAGARNFVFSIVKWLQPAMKGRSCVRQLRARIIFTCDWLRQGLIMAAGLLHGTCFGEDAGARNIVAAAGNEGQLVCVCVRVRRLRCNARLQISL